MSRRNWLLVLALLAILIVGGYVVRTGFRSTTPEAGGQGAGIANPASTNCVSLGGRLEIIDSASGAVGYCHLKDGRVCEEWALFRDGTCSAPQQ